MLLLFLQKMRSKKNKANLQNEKLEIIKESKKQYFRYIIM